MFANEVRKKFLDFFKKKGHKIIPSSSLVPRDDTSLLFSSAGMNQFKEYFLHPSCELKRAASCQKCLRTTDIEKVGQTAGHHTFFEMLGNFSFADYFKNEAIEWAWEFLTSVLNISEEKLWISVFKEDEETYQIWEKKIGISKQKIKRFAGKENFWPSNALKQGPDGPCGPCSEIFYDWGEEFSCGKNCSLNCNCGRFIEIWNLVFTQFNRENGKVAELENKNVDTGMGLERISTVLQGLKNDFDTELFKPIIDSLSAISQQLPANSSYIIADYIRAVVFTIADGVVPGNEKQGYVVRKLVRKMARLGRSLKIKSPFIYSLVPSVVNIAQNTYPELAKEQERIKEIIKIEEEKFKQTINKATAILNTKIDIDEKVAFELYDTYGLPYEDAKNLVFQKGIKLDKEKFIQYMEEQRQRSRKKSEFKKQIFEETKGKEYAKAKGVPLPGVWGEEEIDVARNHTSTHILQSVLREILGKHIKQAGSIIFPTYFHFDFTHSKPLSDDELEKIEKKVNDRILRNDLVKREKMSKQEAIKKGAIGLFEEKYKEKVTIVSIGNSKEFCAGVHVKNTGEIGLFKIVKQSSIGAGVRRIEAVSGRFAYLLVKKQEKNIKQISSLFSTSLEEITKKAIIVIDEIKELKRKNEKLKRKLFNYYSEDLLKQKDGTIIVHQFSDFDFSELRQISDILKNKLNSAVIALASVKDSKIYFLMSVSKDLSATVHCGQIIKEIVQQMDGKGGGKADFAQGSAKEIKKLPEALKIWKEIIKKKVKM